MCTQLHEQAGGPIPGAKECVRDFPEAMAFADRIVARGLFYGHYGTEGLLYYSAMDVLLDNKGLDVKGLAAKGFTGPGAVTCQGPIVR